MTTVKEQYAPNRWGLRWHQPYTLRGIRYESQGLDILAGANTPVLAPVTMRIIEALNSPTLGETITGLDAHGNYWTFCHIVNRKIGNGKTIPAGTVLAHVAWKPGTTGTSWTGTHIALHTGRHLNSAIGISTTDPATLLKGISY